MYLNNSIESIVDNIYLLPHNVFPLYIIKGDQNYLVDCSVLAYANNIYSAINTFLRNEPIHSVLLTHSHYDHTGAITFLQSIYNFSIFCSKRTKEILSNPVTIQFIDRLNQDYKKQLNVINSVQFLMPKNLEECFHHTIIPIAKKQFIQVFETPGHTKCSLSFLLHPQMILFCGDSTGIIEKNRKVKPLFLSSYLQYEKTLKMMMSLPIFIIALPHNRFICGQNKVSNYLQQSLQETEQARDFILNKLQNGNLIESIAEEILNTEYPNSTLLGPKEAMLINISAMIKSIKKEFTNLT